MNTLWQKFQTWWIGLPHGVKVVLTAFAGGFVGVAWPVVKHWAAGDVVCAVAAWPCAKEYIEQAVKGGIMAVGALYLPSPFHKP